MTDTPDRTALLIEADRRGLLPPEMKASLDEARNRGLVPANIDFTQHPDVVRQQIATLPDKAKERAYNDWADAYVAKEREGARKTTIGSIGQAAGDDLRNVARGTLVGSFLDEANAYTHGALHGITGGRMGAPTDEVLAYNRATDRAIDKEFPIASVAGQLVGGVGSAVGLVRPAATVAGNIAKGATAGGAYGAISGFGSGEGDASNRLSQAGTGAMVGAALGGAIPAAVGAGRAAYGQARDALYPAALQRTQGPQAAADYILARRLGQAGSNPNAVATDLATGDRARTFNANSQAPLPEMLADTSDDLQRLTGTVYRQGGEAGQTVRDALTGRQRGPANPYSPQPGEMPGQANSVLEGAERAMLIRSAETARRTEASIVAQQRAQGQQLYRQAFDTQQPFDIQPVLDGMALQAQQYPRPFQARLQRALNLFVDDTPNRMPTNTLERFDAAKKALDDMIETSQRQGQGNLTRELTGFKNSLLDAVHGGDSANPSANTGYAAARSAWGTAAENRQAIDLGRQALREGSEVSVDQYQSLGRGQQQLFRIGFLDSLRNAIGSKTPGDDVTRLFQQRRVQELLNEIVPRSAGRTNAYRDRPERFGEFMNRQQRMVQTRNAVLGNSATEQRRLDDARGAGDMLSSALQALRGGTSWALEAVVTTLNRVAGFNQAVSTELARTLTSTDPQAQAAALQRIQQRMGEAQFRVFTDQISRVTQAGARSAATYTGQQKQVGAR